MVSEMPRPGRTPDTSLARGLKLIGVSGAGGGAAAAELTAGILEGAGKRAALLRRGEHTGAGRELRDALRRMSDAGLDYAVLELPPEGRDLEELSDLAFFQRVYTELPENASAALFKRGGINILNLDAPGAEEAVRAAGGGIYTYSARSDAADLSAKNIKLGPDSVCFAALMTGRLEKLRVARPGMESVYGTLAAAASAVNAGIGLEAVRGALGQGGGEAKSRNTLGRTL